MEDAKVLINLKEGIIEMEGPADFVRHCLDMYKDGIGKVLGLPQDTTAVPERARRVSQKRTPAVVAKPRTRKPATVMATMRDDLEAGFFDKPRSTAEIKQRVTEAGLTFTDTGVRANLRKLTQDGLLNAVKKGRSVKFKRRS